MTAPPATWVLLRGLAREAGHWGAFPPLLAERLGPGGRVLTPDLPGNGMLHAQRSASQVPGMVAALRAGLSPTGPVHVVALSLGGMVAVEWARQAPQEVAEVVLVNSSLRGHSPFWQRLRPASWPTLAATLLPGRSRIAREAAILRVTSGRPALHPQAPSRWAQIAALRPVRPANALRQLLAAARYRAPAQPPAVPMRVLCSAGDRLVSMRCSQVLAQRWQLPIAIHPWAGHDLPLDDPHWMVDQLLLSKP